MTTTNVFGDNKLRDGRRLPQVLLAWYALCWLVMAIEPVDRQDWMLENILAVSLVAGLLFTYRWFTFSNGAYVLLTLFLTLHAVGAHYTYAEVPAGFWLQDVFQLSRNPFDRLTHFAYGFLLVFPIRELLVRFAGVQGVWSFILAVCVTLAKSGLFEVMEAVVAEMVSPELGSAYLGTQGDEWDAQKDMACALAGAVLMTGLILGLSKIRPTPEHLP